MKKLKGELVKVNKINQLEANRMYDIMDKHFDNLSLPKFIDDLKKKSLVILLRDSQGLIQGFSTMSLFSVTLPDLKFNTVFSGDTVITQDYWGDLELPKMWIQYVMSLPKSTKDAPLYWILISKGYRTYRYLPLFLKEFYPRYDQETPSHIQKVMNYFGATFYPKNYNSSTGVIELNGTEDYLKEEIAGVSEHLARNPHISFFIAKNVNYRRGDELVCVAELNAQNFRRSGLRYL